MEPEIPSPVAFGDPPVILDGFYEMNRLLTKLVRSFRSSCSRSGDTRLTTLPCHGSQHTPREGIYVMSLTWMALIAVLVALERIGPWVRGASLASAGVLLVLAAGLLLAPHLLPGFVVPSSPASPHVMGAMG